MNLLSLLDTIGAAPIPPVAADVPAFATGRRALLRVAGLAGGRALAASLPLALLATPAATAQPTETTLDTLTLLLTLADLQTALYTRALDTEELIPASALPDITLMQTQQQQQQTFLRGLFTPAGAVVPAVPLFDFSGSHSGAGPALFPDAFTSFSGFLALAQPLADAAARVYLGQLSSSRTDEQLLGAIVRRQAVEARQASHLRTLRRSLNAPSSLPKSWSSPTDLAAPAALAALQAGENNLNQLVPGASSGARYVDFNALFTSTSVQTTALAEAFDEPLSTAEARTLLALFQ